MEIFHRCIAKANASYGDVGSEIQEIYVLQKHAVNEELDFITEHAETALLSRKQTILRAMGRLFCIITQDLTLSDSMILFVFHAVRETYQVDFREMGIDPDEFQKYVCDKQLLERFVAECEAEDEEENFVDEFDLVDEEEDDLSDSNPPTPLN
jgi:hypothetical protein